MRYKWDLKLMLNVDIEWYMGTNIHRVDDHESFVLFLKLNSMQFQLFIVAI